MRAGFTVVLFCIIQFRDLEDICIFCITYLRLVFRNLRFRKQDILADS